MKSSYAAELSDLINATFINGTWSCPLLVDDVEYPCKIGSPMPDGWYKNGVKVASTPDFSWMIWVVFTARGGECDVELQVQFNRKGSTYELTRMLGFDGVDLLKADTIENCSRYLIGYLYSLRGESEKSEEYA